MQGRILGIQDTGVLRCRRCTAYYTALVSHAMRHRNRVQDTSWQSQGGETGGGPNCRHCKHAC